MPAVGRQLRPPTPLLRLQAKLEAVNWRTTFNTLHHD